MLVTGETPASITRWQAGYLQARTKAGAYCSFWQRRKQSSYCEGLQTCPSLPGQSDPCVKGKNYLCSNTKAPEHSTCLHCVRRGPRQPQPPSQLFHQTHCYLDPSRGLHPPKDRSGPPGRKTLFPTTAVMRGAEDRRLT